MAKDSEPLAYMNFVAGVIRKHVLDILKTFVPLLKGSYSKWKNMLFALRITIGLKVLKTVKTYLGQRGSHKFIGMTKAANN